MNPRKLLRNLVLLLVCICPTMEGTFTCKSNHSSGTYTTGD